MSALILFVSLAAFLTIGIPIFIALSSSVALTFVLVNPELDLVIILQRMFAGLNKFSLMSIPLFIFAANIMSEGGISQRIIRLANVFVGRIPGGLGMTVILSSMFFGAISGSAPATVVAIGALLYPALLQENYSENFSVGVITASGSLGVIIPPSVTMIVYATVTGTSVGELFVSGFGAGIMFGAILMAYTYVYAKRHPEVIRVKRSLPGEKIGAIRQSFWGMGIPIIIIGGIYGGIFTPTEAAAVAVIYAMIVALFIYREMTLKDLLKTALKSGITTIQVMILLAAASVFAWILTAEGITLALAQTVINISANPYVILLMLNIVLLIAGMFIDGASIITILGPLFFPIAMTAGINPVHLGVVMVVNTAIGMYTPPFGLNLFVASGITNLSITRISRAVIPFIIVTIIAMLIITYIPQISLFLPRLIYGR